MHARLNTPFQGPMCRIKSLQHQKLVVAWQIISCIDDLRKGITAETRKPFGPLTCDGGEATRSNQPIADFACSFQGTRLVFKSETGKRNDARYVVVREGALLAVQGCHGGAHESLVLIVDGKGFKRRGRDELVHGCQLSPEIASAGRYNQAKLLLLGRQFRSRIRWREFGGCARRPLRTGNTGGEAGDR
jgi:hypothetical protein